MKPDCMNGRVMELLLVEDNEDDVELTRLGFEKAKLILHLHRVENGEQAMAFLRKQGQYAGAPTPDLILLDMNLPVMNGHEVLAEIVADDQLRHLPVVVLTTSSADEDILAMYTLRCSSYIVKPVDFRQFMRVIQSIEDYWFTAVVLPSKKKNGDV